MNKISFTLMLLFFCQSILAVNGVPGPRDCFWSRGPHSGDPYINLAYPDGDDAQAFPMAN